MLIEYLAVAGIVLIFILTVILLRVIASQQQQQQQQHRPHRSQGATSYKSTQIDYSRTERQGELFDRLGQLLYGDFEAVNRLVKDVEEKYPGQHYEWYLEKVIQDIERDRSR